MDITQLPQLPIDWGTRNARHQRLLARETHKRGSRPTALALHESAWPWLLQSHNQKFTRHYSHFSELCLLCLVALAQACFWKKLIWVSQDPSLRRYKWLWLDYDSENKTHHSVRICAADYPSQASSEFACSCFPSAVASFHSQYLTENAPTCL